MLVDLTYSKLIHVKHLLVINSAHDQVIRSFLLSIPIGEQGSIILVTNVLQSGEIFEGVDIILLVVKVLLALWVAKSVVCVEDVVDHLA